MIRLRLMTLYVVVVCLLVSCSGSSELELASYSPPKLPCEDAISAEAFLRSFFDAVERGSLQAARSHFSTTHESFEFFWDKFYPYPESLGSSGIVDEDFGLIHLEPQLVSLIARGDTFILSSFGYGIGEVQDDGQRKLIGHFNYTGIRQTSNGSIRLVGKGSLDCSEGRIKALSLA